MSRKIKLNNLCKKVQIGIHPHELNKPQEYCVSVTLYLADDYVVVADCISEAVDYDILRTSILHLMDQPYNLQETFAQELLDLAFKVDSRVNKVKVSVAKTTIYEDCDSVGLVYKTSRKKHLGGI